MFDDDYTNEAHERRIKRCRSASCNARIIYLPTTNGKRIPCDADTVESEDTEFDPQRHEAHFAKCPDADKWRKPR